MAWVRRWGTGPPVEPQTYLNALSSASLHSAPTESELQEGVRRSWWRIALSQWRTLQLELVLLQFDVLMAVAVAMGTFTPQEERKRRHKTRDPG